VTRLAQELGFADLKALHRSSVEVPHAGAAENTQLEDHAAHHP
jgi:hypothetical protein